MKIPKQQIEWLVSRMHVSRANWEVRMDIKARCTAPKWTPEAITEAEDYAVKCHRINQGLYSAVVSGRL